MEVLLSGDDVHGGSTCRLAWSDLQPFEKPALEGGRAARVRWRFHVIDVRAALSEWRRGRDNHWEINSAPGSADAHREWRTGHLEVAVSFGMLGRSIVQLGAPRHEGPQLLQFSPGMHLCLEHRATPLAAFSCGPCFAAGAPAGLGPWPSHTDAWPSEAAYAGAWRRLCFMEAAACAVADNDSKILGGLEVEWVAADDGRIFGTFSVPAEVKDAHQVKFRTDDLVCLRWRQRDVPAPPAPRAANVASVFALLNRSGSGFLSSAEMRAFAEVTGFQEEPSAPTWSAEYAALCRELGCEESMGIDAASFAGLVDDTSDDGAYCSDVDLRRILETLQPPRPEASPAKGETWVVHALVDGADAAGDEVQIRLRPQSRGRADVVGPTMLGSGDRAVWLDCVAELMPLPESYHYASAALSDLALSKPLVRDLVITGRVARPLHVNNSSRAIGAQDLVHFKLNESQEEAVRAALSEPVTLIHGPPGTGKTRTAAALALTFARRNAAAQERASACVLYSASGNRAVDVAVEAIDELSVERLEDLFQARSDEGEICSICWSEGCNVITFCGHVFHHRCLTQALRAAPRGVPRQCPMCRSGLKSFTGVRLLRIYSGDTERLEFPVPRKYEYEGVQDRRRRAVPEEMRHFAMHWRIHNKVPGHVNPFAADCGAAYEELLRVGAGGADFDEARAKYADLRKKARAFELRNCDVLLTTNCSCRRSWVADMLLQQGVELQQVISDEAGTTPEPEALCPMTLARHAEHVVLVGDYRQLRPVIKNRDASALGLGRSLFERLAMLAEAPEPVADLAGQQPAADRSGDPEVERLVDVHGRPALVDAIFKQLDVDDSGRLNHREFRPFAEFTGFDGGDDDWDAEYASLCQHLDCRPDGGLGLEDFRRLVDDDSEDGCYCTDEELREFAGLPPAAPVATMKATAARPASVLLRQQYRMHPSMNRFSSQQFYGGQVGDDVSTRQRLPGILVHPKTQSRCATLFWCSPASHREEVQEVASRDASTRSKANPLEAERCALAVRHMLRAGARSVAVLSWYNAQVAELRRRVHAQPGCEGVHVGSVVTAQGSEWDYVLLSTVRSAGSSRGLGCLADRHLLNVAVTRGRLGIVVLGSPEALRANKHWAAFVAHCQEDNGIVEPEDFPHFLVSQGHPGHSPA